MSVVKGKMNPLYFLLPVETKVDDFVMSSQFGARVRATERTIVAIYAQLHSQK